MQNSCKASLFQLIEDGRLSEASTYTDQHIREHQNEEYFVLFYILLRIREEERQAKVTDFFSSSLGHNPETLLEHYLQIKLYLRRFEYQMADDVLQEALNYFATYHVSPYALYRIAQFACITPANAFQKLAERYDADGKLELAAIFRQTAGNET